MNIEIPDIVLKLPEFFLRRKNDPYFMIIGAQKSATSSLHFYLDQHPKLMGTAVKELHYFDRDIYTGKTLEYYRSNFRGFHDQYHFESTPSYIYTPETASRIHACYPDMRFIVVLRDPVKRAFSAWNHYKQLFDSGQYKKAIFRRHKRPGHLLYEKFFMDRVNFPDFRECIEIEFEMIKKGEGFEPALLRRGLYLEQLEAYWNYFLPAQIKIVGFKDLVSNTTETLNNLCDFIGVKPLSWENLNHEPQNTRKYLEVLSPCDQAILEKFYAKPNQKLFEKIGTVNW